MTSNFLWVITLRGTPTPQILVFIRLAWASPHGSEIYMYRAFFYMCVFRFFAKCAAQTCLPMFMHNSSKYVVWFKVYSSNYVFSSTLTFVLWVNLSKTPKYVALEWTILCIYNSSHNSRTPGSISTRLISKDVVLFDKVMF